MADNIEAGCPLHGPHGLYFTQLCYYDPLSVDLYNQMAFWKCRKCHRSGATRLKKIYDALQYNNTNVRASSS